MERGVPLWVVLNMIKDGVENSRQESCSGDDEWWSIVRSILIWLVEAYISLVVWGLMLWWLVLLSLSLSLSPVVEGREWG